MKATAVGNALSPPRDGAASRSDSRVLSVEDRGDRAKVAAIVQTLDVNNNGEIGLGEAKRLIYYSSGSCRLMTHAGRCFQRVLCRCADQCDPRHASRRADTREPACAGGGTGAVAKHAEAARGQVLSPVGLC